ncbi:hypothetical protein HOD61_02095 [archaeon]|nr:hypothetical protein [archaeon]
MIGVLFLVVLFLVFEGLGTENNVMENNSFVMTGAAVIDVFKESDLFGDFSFESLNPIPALKNIFSNDDSGW